MAKRKPTPAPVAVEVTESISLAEALAESGEGETVAELAAPQVAPRAKYSAPSGGFAPNAALVWLVTTCPKRGKAAGRATKYWLANTVAEYLQNGTKEDLKWDFAHKFFTVQ